MSDDLFILQKRDSFKVKLVISHILKSKCKECKMLRLTDLNDNFVHVFLLKNLASTLFKVGQILSFSNLEKLTPIDPVRFPVGVLVTDLDQVEIIGSCTRLGICKMDACNQVIDT